LPAAAPAAATTVSPSPTASPAASAEPSSSPVASPSPAAGAPIPGVTPAGL
jgi:hypothetical protein